VDARENGARVLVEPRVSSSLRAPLGDPTCGRQANGRGQCPGAWAGQGHIPERAGGVRQAQV